MVWEVHTRRAVDADAEAVWRVLTALDAYGEWNPTIPSLSGEIEVGERLSGRLSVGRGVTVPFRPTVRVVDPETELRWEATVGGRGTIDADHVFEIDDANGGVTVTQTATFEGVLAAPIMGRSGHVVRRSMEALNDALAAEAAGRDLDDDR